MERYRKQYPDAYIVLFEPDREDADMFFANIFSYSQRKRLCAAAYRKTRQNLLARSGEIGPVLKRWFEPLGAPGDMLKAVFLLNGLPE